MQKSTSRWRYRRYLTGARARSANVMTGRQKISWRSCHSMSLQRRQFNLSISSGECGPTMLQENDKGGNFSQQESASTVMYSTVYLPWFYVACCANVLFLVEEMSTSLRFTQQRLDQRTYLLKSWWIPPRLQEAAMLKEMWQCSAEFWHGDYLQLWISRFFYALEARGPQWISTKRQKVEWLCHWLEKQSCSSSSVISWKLIPARSASNHLLSMEHILPPHLPPQLTLICF